MHLKLTGFQHTFLVWSLTLSLKAIFILGDIFELDSSGSGSLSYFKEKEKCKVTHEWETNQWAPAWVYMDFTGTGLYYSTNHTFCAAFMQASLQLTLKDRLQSWMKTNVNRTSLSRLAEWWRRRLPSPVQHTLCVPTYLWHMERSSSSVYCSTGIVTIMKSTRSCSISEWQTLLNNNNPFHLQA